MKAICIWQMPEEQLSLFPEFAEDEWVDMDGQEQMETLLKTRLKALKNERSEVTLLLEATKRCQEAGPDAKAEVLLDWIYKLQGEENNSDLNFICLTAHIKFTAVGLVLLISSIILKN